MFPCFRNIIAKYLFNFEIFATAVRSECLTTLDQVREASEDAVTRRCKAYEGRGWVKRRFIWEEVKLQRRELQQKAARNWTGLRENARGFVTNSGTAREDASQWNKGVKWELPELAEVITDARDRLHNNGPLYTPLTKIARPGQIKREGKKISGPSVSERGEKKWREKKKCREEKKCTLAQLQFGFVFVYYCMTYLISSFCWRPNPLNSH